MKKFFLFLLVIPFCCAYAHCAERIVVLNSDGLEVIRALNAGDLVVGVSDVIINAPSFWGEYSNLPLAGGWKSPDYEMIVKLKATVVLAYKRSPDKAAEKKLNQLGIKVFRYDFYKLSSFDEEVTEFASLIGREKEADELLTWWRALYAKIENISTDLNKSSHPKVYIEGFGTYKSSGPGSGIHEMVTLAGGNNLAKTASIPYPEVDPEWILSNNPDYIVKMVPLRDCYNNSCAELLKQAVKEISGRNAIHSLKAVRDGKIIAITPDIGPGPRGIIGAIELAKRMHPDDFEDINPLELHSYYLKRFQGLDFSGVYIYPEGGN